MIHQKQKIGFYLAGLFEGDGHIIIGCDKYPYNTRFHITFHKKDLPLAQKLLNQIDFGFIRHKQKENACVLTIHKVKGLKKLIDLINGKLRTPKIRQVYAMIDWLNKRHNAKIPKLGLNKTPIYQNAWLAGFIDADGSFDICYTKKTAVTKRQVRCRFRLEQRMLDPKTGESYEPCLSAIATYLNTKLNIRRQKNTGRSYYLITLSSVDCIKILKDYLDTYALFSSKRLDYTDWARAADLIIDKLHYTDKGLLVINTLKQNMNRKRAFFNWTHLDDF